MATAECSPSLGQSHSIDRGVRIGLGQGLVAESSEPVYFSLLALLDLALVPSDKVNYSPVALMQRA